VGTMAVVVPEVDPKDLLKVTAADDQQPVQALATNGPNPPFGEGVMSRDIVRTCPGTSFTFGPGVGSRGWGRG
jgi:hypothetical protein